jgi:hypothetical protein
MRPGREVAGVVDEVGADVDAGLVGERGGRPTKEFQVAPVVRGTTPLPI